MSAPIVDPWGASDLFAELTHRLHGYVPELTPATRGPADALLNAVARYQSILIQGLNEVPERRLAAAFDRLGMHLLSAAAARVPLVFALAADTPIDVTLPAGTQVAAPPAPQPPAVDPAAPSAATPEPIVFATERTVTLCRAGLVHVYSVEPGADRFADHTAGLTSGFTFLDDLKQTEHALYLGHDTLFAFGGEIALIIGVALERPARAPLDLRWDYLSSAGWIPLASAKEEDTTGAFTASGQVVLRRECGPDARRETFDGRSSFWLRAVSRSPVIPGSAALPLVVNDLNARVQFRKSGLAPETAFADFVKLDVSKDFLPFGGQPATSSAFYLKSTEVFQRAGARAEVAFTLSKNGKAHGTLKLAWDYSTGEGWQPLPVEPNPTGNRAYLFQASGVVRFSCPADWSEVDVNGVSGRWLRARIAHGDYGKPIRLDPARPTVLLKSSLTPPIVSNVALAFEYLTDLEPLDHCLSLNNFVFGDHTDACRWPDRTFAPFQAAPDSSPAVNFAFDKPLPIGLVSLYLQVPDFGSALPPVSPYVWEYQRASDWAELSVVDETAGFRQNGMLQFVGPRDAVATNGFGGIRYRVRARLKHGEALVPAPVVGVWLNAAWGVHQRRIEREMLGLSDGNPGQTLRFARAPVLEGEAIEVREWTGKGEAWTTVLEGVPDADVRLERDPATGKATAAWVRWHERSHLHDSSASDCHYVVERATGLLRFGAGVPAAGKRIGASYTTGGGSNGNVAVGAVRELRAAVPFLAGVHNPVRAQGGAAAESTVEMLRRGPERVRHRDRALSARDYEWLVHDASPDVARSRCEPLTGPAGHAQRGWVTIRVAPKSADAQPAPSPELARRIRSHVAAHAPAGVAFRIQAPAYVVVSVLATITPDDPATVAVIETRVRGALNRFLHPLTGGPSGVGWDFGQPLHVSQIATVIESTPGVDFAGGILLGCEGTVYDAFVPVPANAAIAAGNHELTLRMGGR